jgi:superfamily II DNA helicase RecQ
MEDVWTVVEQKQHTPGFIWKATPDGRRWTSMRFRHAIKRSSLIGMGVELTSAVYRQCAVAIADKYIAGIWQNVRTQRTKGEDGMQEASDAGNRAIDVLAQQAGHQTAIRGNIYGRGMDEGTTESRTAIWHFEAASAAWAQFQGFVPESNKRAREEDPLSMAVKRWKAAKSKDQLSTLQQIVGHAEAEFRGVQKEAMEAIMQGKSPVMVVMGTGGGKSMMFTIPAINSAQTGYPGTTVVVVPIISLQQDHKRRIDELQQKFSESDISCVVWRSDGPRPAMSTSVILITPESVMTKAFAQHMSRMRGTQTLDRMVIDECHTAFDSVGGFRPSMRMVGRRAMEMETQVVLLTATCPPDDVRRLAEIMQISSDSIHLFRTTTTRKNIRYSIRTCPGKKLQEIVDVVQEMERWRSGPGKIIVYSNTTVRVEKLADAIGCGKYHGQMKVEDKAVNMAAWMADPRGVIVATNAMGLGIDQPDVVAVIHAERPDHLRDYGQESGRGGRDGRVSRAIIMDSGDRLKRRENPDDFGNHGARKGMAVFLSVFEQNAMFAGRVGRVHGRPSPN